jgi:uracil DNA glycosylase
MVTVFWAKKGVILPNFLPRVTAMKSNCYTEPLRSMNAHLLRVRPTKMSEVFLVHGNFRSHSSMCITETITNFGWTVVSHSPYSRRRAMLDCLLFDVLIKGLRRHHDVSDKVVQNAMC